MVQGRREMVGGAGRMSQGTSGTNDSTEMSDGMTQEENGDMPGDATSDGTRK